MRRFVCIWMALLCACSSGDNTAEQENAPEMINYANKSEQLDRDREEVVVFVYHRFGDSRHISTNISIEDFRKQLRYLQSAGFEVVTLGQALGTPANDAPRAVITVDDSYRSFLSGAMPVLREFDFPATLFVNTSTVGGEDFLTWSELDSISDLGIEIGNHSHSHAYFLDLESRIYADSFRTDIMHAQSLFRENLGESPDLFAYPYGEYDSVMMRIVREAGFRAAMAQNSGVVLKGQDMFSLPRFPVSDAYSDLEAFKDKANARAFKVRFESPSIPVTSAERPVWKLVTQENLQRGRMQCFVQGGFCRMDSSGDTLIVESESPLQGRRVLYTITMPDTDGNWYWRSHLWINTRNKVVEQAGTE